MTELNVDGLPNGFPWPGPLEPMADQAVARLIGLDTPADTRPT